MFLKYSNSILTDSSTYMLKLDFDKKKNSLKNKG